MRSIFVTWVFLGIIISINLNSCTSGKYLSKETHLIDSLVQVKNLSYKDIFYNKDNAPTDFTFSKELKCPSIQGNMFYEINESYEGLALPKLRDKKYQTFSYAGEIGSVMYFEYERNVSNAVRTFIDGLFYGERREPYRKHPEEYLIFENIIIVWGFKLDSDLKKIHKKYVISVLKNK